MKRFPLSKFTFLLVPLLSLAAHDSTGVCCHLMDLHLEDRQKPKWRI